ncbi:hypothetical protein GCM10027451_10680 [Geodermatophilus aquaeductus]|uniref:Uncharacterized alpha/beta hydrolase domain n=1 Tax=Geodermatophilus aquaeductus TaxID=1564161 RepID=A0A521DQ03_9ACTN|nr:DUF2235 domain-containing protein [Geodermatophilus aquaeductus]SMO73784.1 Uncharacterized alpha/beta hydrolase domain [Geodermatophilus aquaeductus]
MPKRLVIRCDGTWNTPDQTAEGWPCPTNVTKVALEIAPAGEDGMRQCVYYLRGIGTARGERFREGAFVVGLSRAVKDAYRTIVEKAPPAVPPADRHEPPAHREPRLEHRPAVPQRLGVPAGHGRRAPGPRRSLHRGGHRPRVRTDTKRIKSVGIDGIAPG